PWFTSPTLLSPLSLVSLVPLSPLRPLPCLSRVRPVAHSQTRPQPRTLLSMRFRPSRRASLLMARTCAMVVRSCAVVKRKGALRTPPWCSSRVLLST
ncbi:hypothetical protein FRC11_008055, partial [Ceratobasidium sp. 423]